MTPLCECHGLPMGWQIDKKLRAGGRWECREKRREYNQRRAEARTLWMAEDRKRSPRQYLYERRRALAEQRARYEARLIELNQEAEALVVESRSKEPEETESDQACRVHAETTARTDRLGGGHAAP